MKSSKCSGKNLAYSTPPSLISPVRTMPPHRFICVKIKRALFDYILDAPMRTQLRYIRAVALSFPLHVPLFSYQFLRSLMIHLSFEAVLESDVIPAVVWVRRGRFGKARCLSFTHTAHNHYSRYFRNILNKFSSCPTPLLSMFLAFPLAIVPLFTSRSSNSTKRPDALPRRPSTWALRSLVV